MDATFILVAVHAQTFIWHRTGSRQTPSELFTTLIISIDIYLCSCLQETDRGAALWLRERSACGGGDDAQAMAYAFEAPPRGSRSRAGAVGHAARRPQAGRQVGRCLITDVFHNNTGRSAIISASVAPIRRDRTHPAVASRYRQERVEEYR
jgi:hypothetical protein